MSGADTHYQILVVEDTIAFAQLTIMTLERRGFSACHAKDGETAITMLEEQQPDLILLDLNLPGMSGWQLLEHITKQYGEAAIPVIVTTAYSDEANRVAGEGQGISRYLVKPFRPDELMSAIQDVLATPNPL